MHTRDQLQQIIGDDYQLQWIIGHGGMSTVWLADDLRHQREVAIKVMRPEYTNNDEFLARFRNEAVAAEGIASDNVVTTYDYREVEESAGHTTCFLVMEYVRGESLADMLAREGELREDIALDVLEQSAHGLSILHRHGLVHRDIKPGNLLITQSGQVKITDFGIAKAAEAVPLTRTGMVVGTAQYVSPEQAQGQEVSPASDVYSLGVVGYEMLAGRRPFTGDSGISVALAHVSEAPPALPTSVSAEVRELIGIALRKDPATRFADGNEMALAVSAVRLGSRPPQPKSSAMQQVAPEPSPTESTMLLGQVAQPRTTQPAPGTVRPATAQTQQPAAQVKAKKRGGGFGTGLFIAILIAALIGLGLWAASSTNLGDIFQRPDPSPTPTEPTEPEVITEWVTETEAPTQQQRDLPPEPVSTVTQPRPVPEDAPEPPPPPAPDAEPPAPASPPPADTPAPAPAPAPQPVPSSAPSSAPAPAPAPQISEQASMSQQDAQNGEA